MISAGIPLAFPHATLSPTLSTAQLEVDFFWSPVSNLPLGGIRAGSDGGLGAARISGSRLPLHLYVMQGP